jgi:hypothetical protein
MKHDAPGAVTWIGKDLYLDLWDHTSPSCRLVHASGPLISGDGELGVTVDDLRANT